MFPLGPENSSPEPDIIGTAGADRGRPRWRRFMVAGGVLVLAGIIIGATVSSVLSVGRPSSTGRQSVASRPSGEPVNPAPVPAASTPGGWVASLNIANWPMPGSGSAASSMFAGGVAGNRGWELTVNDVARPGQRCAAAVVIDGDDGHPIGDAYPISPHPLSRTPAGDLAFIALGARSPGVGVGFLQLAGPAIQASVDPDRIGGLEISGPILTMSACGNRYYLAGFAYPLAGTLDVSVSWPGISPIHYLVPTRLSRPKVARVWESTG